MNREWDFWDQQADVLRGYFYEDEIYTWVEQMRHFDTQIQQNIELWPEGDADFKRFVCNVLVQEMIRHSSLYIPES